MQNFSLPVLKERRSRPEQLQAWAGLTLTWCCSRSNMDLRRLHSEAHSRSKHNWTTHKKADTNKIYSELTNKMQSAAPPWPPFTPRGVQFNSHLCLTHGRGFHYQPLAECWLATMTNRGALIDCTMSHSNFTTEFLFNQLRDAEVREKDKQMHSK